MRSEEEGSVRVGFRRGRRVGERYGGKSETVKEIKLGLGLELCDGNENILS